MTIVHVHLCAPHYHNISRYQRILVLIKMKKKDGLKILNLFNHKEEYDNFFYLEFYT